jgi:aldose 1-epimerase
MRIKKEKITNIENHQVYKITFTNKNNYIISFYNFGGYINNILIPYNHNLYEHEDVLLGYRNFEEYISDQSYLNCIIGRVCGRIANAQFNLNDRTYELFSNDGHHHLHGGRSGFNKKVWHIDSLDEKSEEISCELHYNSPHLEEGYPGNLQCRAKYILNDNNEFIIQFHATTDYDTLVNLTNHNYWNFHGHKKFYQKILGHCLEIHSCSYCEIDKNFIPTGKINYANKTKYDFSSFKKINNYELEDNGIDLCYIVEKYDGTLKKIASLYSNKTKMGAQILSDQPCVQFYTGNMMKQSYNGKFNKNYGYQHALCLEPQLFPNAFNQKNIKSSVLHNDKQYASTIVMRLGNNFDE